jgi:hypothetical protein
LTPPVLSCDSDELSHHASHQACRCLDTESFLGGGLCLGGALCVGVLTPMSSE